MGNCSQKAPDLFSPDGNQGEAGAQVMLVGKSLRDLRYHSVLC